MKSPPEGRKGLVGKTSHGGISFRQIKRKQNLIQTFTALSPIDCRPRPQTNHMRAGTFRSSIEKEQQIKPGTSGVNHWDHNFSTTTKMAFDSMREKAGFNTNRKTQPFSSDEPTNNETKRDCSVMSKDITTESPWMGRERKTTAVSGNQMTPRETHYDNIGNSVLDSVRNPT